MIYDWNETYQQRLTDPDSAIKNIKRGQRVFIGSACGEPQLLVRSLLKIAPHLSDTELIHFLDLGNEPYADSRYDEHLHHNALFIGANTRQAIMDGRADYTPIFLSEIPLLMLRGRMHIDVALVTVSPPDNNGYVSLGVSVDITKTATEVAKVVIAEVNPNMPRTHGDSFLHVSEIDHFIENSEPLLEYHEHSPDHIISRIATHIADLIDNGSTIQTGVGRIPSSVLPHLKHKRDLGVHTEVFTEGIIDLIEAGVINNSKKNIHPGKVIASFCMGNKRLYEYIHDNPLFEFHPSRYTNDPNIIAKNKRFISINAALTVDLTGQVCSDSLGFNFYSGIGGQVDFVRGSAMSKHGKSIITLPSTTDDGLKSRIVPFLEKGSGVVVTRGDIHYVVTEFGAAYIHGKSIRERALALINIAHPDFRDELLAAAKEQHYVFQDQILPSVPYPRQYESHWQDKQNQEIFFRPVKPTDERSIQDMIYSLPDQDIYTRFFHSLKSFPHKLAMPMAAIDYSDKMAIAGVIGREEPESKEEIIAMGHYVRDPNSNMADVAFTIKNQWHNRGIGTHILRYLIRIARENNIEGFTADVLSANSPMLKVFAKAGYPMQSHLESGVYEIMIKFDEGLKD